MDTDSMYLTKKEQNEAIEKETEEFKRGLELIIILVTVLIPVVISIANTSINVEAVTRLSGNTITATVDGKTTTINLVTTPMPPTNSIKAYYSEKLTLLNAVYFPQWNALFNVVFSAITFLFIALIILLFSKGIYLLTISAGILSMDTLILFDSLYLYGGSIFAYIPLILLATIANISVLVIMIFALCKHYMIYKISGEKNILALIITPLFIGVGIIGLLSEGISINLVFPYSLVVYIIVVIEFSLFRKGSKVLK